MTKFLLIRHATTDAVGKRLSGRMPGVHLNDTGKEEARQLAERLKGFPIVAIYSSPLERASETAAPLAEIINCACVVTHGFLEIDYGSWTNCSFEQLQNDPQFIRFNTFRSGTRIPGGETMQEAQGRIIAGIEKLSLKHNNELVAIVSHSDLIKSAIAYYAGISLDMIRRIEISPASVSMVNLFEDSVQIAFINNTGDFRI
jgi:probable phosphomutase (TIGR03848 family)